ncbi:MAG: DUF11 domain-containing protein [Solirubrobacteraceae bacterium]|nr:DUF11 domain-containing protein [Solirubrobacteraceae bacterium]
MTPLPIPARRRRVLRTTVIALSALVAAAPATASAAVSQEEAAGKALSALGVSERTTPEVVFVTPTPVSKGTEIRLGGPERVGKISGTNRDGLAKADTRLIAKVADRSWLFYDDLAPGKGSQRPGRVALVSTSDGKVTVTEQLEWPPLVDGSLPTFLRSTKSYDGSEFRVFERGVKTARRLADDNLLLISPDELNGRRIVSALDAKTCFIQMGDALKDGLFPAEGYGSTASVVEKFGVRMTAFRKSLGTARYGSTSQALPSEWLASKLRNCKDAFVWIGSAGFSLTDTLTLGMRPTSLTGKKVELKQLSGNDLFNVAKARRSTRITLMIDAPNRATFEPRLRTSSNVRLLPVPAGISPGSRAPGDRYLTYSRRMLTGWLRQAQVMPTNRFESSPLCQAGIPFFFSRALDPTSCTAPVPPPPPVPAPAPPLQLLIPTTDLTLGVSTTTPTPERGGVVSLNISLTNVGPEPTTNTFVKVPIPAGLTLRAPFSPDYDAATGLWNVGPVASGAVRILQLEAIAGSVAPSTLTAEVFSSTPSDPDSVPNNGAPGEDDISSVTITPLAADLELTASPSAGTWTSGSPRDLTITLTNKGPQAAIGNTVQVELPAGVDFDAQTLTGGSYNSGNGLWTVPTLGVNESITLKLFVNVLTTGTKIIPISLIGADRGDPDSTPANGPGEDDNATLTIPVT